MLKISEIRNLGEDEIKEKVAALKKQLMQYRFQAKTGKLEQQNLIKSTRRDVAKLLTVINEKKKEVM